MVIIVFIKPYLFFSNHFEEVVAALKKQMDEQIVWIGENTVIDLDIHGLVPSTVYQVTEGEDAAMAVRLFH